MGKPNKIRVTKSDIQVRRHVAGNGIEVVSVTMVDGKQAHFTQVDPETHRKLRSKAYSYVTP